MIVSGKVLDNNMKPIFDVNVRILGTSISTRTNADGDFSINAPSANSTLRFDHAAYDYDEVKVSEFNSYIELYPPMLDEVVITGSSAKKEDHTLLYVALAAAAIVVVAKTSQKSQPRNVKV